MKYLLIPALAGTLFLGGCADLLRTSGPVVTPAENRASIVVRTQVVAGGMRTAAVPKLTADSINHLVLQIFELDGTQEKPLLDADGNAVQEDLTRNQLSSLITFSKLKAQTKYRIRASAYRAPGTDAANLISTTDAGSYVDVEVLDYDRPTVATLKVKLIDVDFDGQGTFQGVTVTPGGYLPTGPVGISIEGGLEGNPAHQVMLDDYLPPFKNGMTWTYKTVTTLDGVPYGPEKTVIQVISNVASAGFTVTTTTIQEGKAPKDFEEQKTAAEWYPSAETLRELPYEDVTVGAGSYAQAAKFGLASNTATNKQYMWIAHGVGMVKFQWTMMTEDGEGIVLQTLESFVSP